LSSKQDSVRRWIGPVTDRVRKQIDQGVNVFIDSGTGAMTFTFILHDHAYGITSDPLTQFACTFLALIHGVDHVGVHDMQLIEENTTIATLSKGKSVGEKNSVDIPWTLLMEESYEKPSTHYL
jgi:hypothetical protein